MRVELLDSLHLRKRSGQRRPIFHRQIAQGAEEDVRRIDRGGEAEKLQGRGGEGRPILQRKLPRGRRERARENEGGGRRKKRGGGGGGGNPTQFFFPFGPS